jgi:hypothetical protein
VFKLANDANPNAGDIVKSPPAPPDSAIKPDPTTSCCEFGKVESLLTNKYGEVSDALAIRIDKYIIYINNKRFYLLCLYFYLKNKCLITFNNNNSII